MIDIHAVARHYGGTVCKDNALIPTPGHSSRDRGTAIRACPDAPDGALVYCFNGDQQTALSVKALLREDGFLPVAGRRRLSWREHEKLKQAAKEYKRARQASEVRCAQSAKAHWQQAHSARRDHAYLVKKGLEPFGIRQDGEQLIVPMVDRNFQLWNLQAIAPDGFKLFGKNARTAGLFWPHAMHLADGKPSPDQLVIGEGYATMAAIHDATGFAVAAAMTAHNLEAAAKSLRKLFPERQIIVAADDDSHLAQNIGLSFARKAAQAIGAQLATPRSECALRDSGADFADIPRDHVASRISAARKVGG